MGGAGCAFPSPEPRLRSKLGEEERLPLGEAAPVPEDDADGWAAGTC